MEDQDTADKFEAHAIVELFGHQRIAGRVTEQVIGGSSFLRVDVPTTTHAKPYTKYFGNGAIYAMTPVSEDVAQRYAENLRSVPVQPYELADTTTAYLGPPNTQIPI